MDIERALGMDGSEWSSQNISAASPKGSSRRSEASKQQASGKNHMLKLVKNAIKALKESKGSKIVEIKKYLAAKRGVDVKARAMEIAQCVKEGVKSGQLLKTDGKYKVRVKKLPIKKAGGKSPKKAKGAKLQRGVSSSPRRKMMSAKAQEYRRKTPRS